MKRSVMGGGNSATLSSTKIYKQKTMKHLEIKATKRADYGKKATAQVRREGLIPCIVYGEGDTVHFSIEKADLKALIFTPQSYIVNFDIEGQKEVAVMREVQYHPVSDEALHVDFFRVVKNKPISMDIPVETSGVAEGVKKGGKLFLAKRKLRIQATEANLPDIITVDVSDLELGKSIFVSDLNLKDITILTPATTAVCAVRMTRAARGAAAAAAKEGK